MPEITGTTQVKAEVPAQSVIIDKKVEMKQNQEHDPSVAASTTFQEDLVSAGQRNINLIWETTQGQIAKYVILGTMSIDGISVLLSIVLNKDFTAAQGLTLGFVNSLATGVVSFYFSRTNHTQVGGVGIKKRELGEAHR